MHGLHRQQEGTTKSGRRIQRVGGEHQIYLMQEVSMRTAKAPNYQLVVSRGAATCTSMPSVMRLAHCRAP
jgi:hypothetical protein